MNQSLTFGPWKLNKNHTKQSITRSTSVDEIHTTFELGNTKALIKRVRIKVNEPKMKSMNGVTKVYEIKRNRSK